MYKLITYICFYFPLVSSCLNLQITVSKFVSPALAQFIAYFNLALITLGLFLFRKNIKHLSPTNQLFFIFYLLYYSFGLLAMGTSGFKTSVIATFVPVIYFIGFYFLLSNREQFKIFFKVISICFVISAFLTIILIKLNINVYTGEEHGWELDRAGGVTGDANAAAHTSIFAFILFSQLYRPKKNIFRFLKIVILLIIFYSLYLTFSTTGLFVFTIVFFLINYKFFTGLRLTLLAAIIPLFYIGIFALKSQTASLGLSKAQTDKVNNIINLLTFNFDEVDNSGRGDLVEKALYYLYDHPILGNGIDFSVDKLVHNTYVGVWVDSGIFTFLFFIFMLFCYFFRSFSLSPNIRFFSISILTVLYIFMISLQSVINQPYLIVLFVFVGYLIDYNKIDKGYTNIFANKKG
ncbi:O-antigen ligase family protein [Winogradskyella sp. SYSU M77433]|uniref:O-antigen ligase family protein n=1 Tax=Winogradskyella sp. SYSU M77433 TaxID=3042722 RepID=UPI002480B119|nr:O-antigen ligase family protein [Winogradskyella sp. SYSU M77433]MDH7913954.1 O-antigen ligase family protein [Winogradskyella sp. SYSU M77433]